MKWLIKLLGGYTQDEVLTEVVRDLFNTIDEKDILREEGNSWYNGNRKLTDAEKKLLVSEAQVFKQSTLWKVLQNDIKYLANKKMFEQSQTPNDLLAGKLWLYTLDCFKTRITSLVNERGVFNLKK